MAQASFHAVLQLLTDLIPFKPSLEVLLAGALFRRGAVRRCVDISVAFPGWSRCRLSPAELHATIHVAGKFTGSCL